jgi:hypothetical protein
VPKLLPSWARRWSRVRVYDAEQGAGETPALRCMGPDRICWGLLRRRQCLVPTLRAGLLLVSALVVLAWIAVRAAYPFLAIDAPAPGGVLVVEGWVPDSTFRAAIAEFKRNHYSRLLVSGIPLEQGTLLFAYTNYAYVGAATLLKLGMSTNEVAAVPTPETQRDRTYAMAQNIGAWLREHQMSGGNVNVLTEGAHARRSRLMYEKALGRACTVGVLPVPPKGYDPKHWWRSSQGVRVVTGEAIAYAYARLLFRPSKATE